MSEYIQGLGCKRKLNQLLIKISTSFLSSTNSSSLCVGLFKSLYLHLQEVGKVKALDMEWVVKAVKEVVPEVLVL